MKPVKAGIIGCGNISSIYCKNLTSYAPVELVACADIERERAEQKAKEFGIPKACTVEELLSDPEIEIVVNLTIPKVHAQVCLQVLEAGKHVYVEKPLAVTLEEGKHILQLAEAKGLLVGGAPDTFLGGGIQTCRKLIDEGWIGKPIAATAFMMSPGHEHWHPSPEFFYQVGGGPMFDMGPYYLTALIHLISPIRRVSGSATASLAERVITSEPQYGKKVTVETPTHIAGIIDFTNGAVGSIITSFDIFGGANVPRLEIYGSEGSLSVPDPNTFGGPVKIKRRDQAEWMEIPLTHSFTENSRGIGVVDMALALRQGNTPRANGTLTYHVLEAMHGFLQSSESGKHIVLESAGQRSEALPMNWHHQVLF